MRTIIRTIRGYERERYFRNQRIRLGPRRRTRYLRSHNLDVRRRKNVTDGEKNFGDRHQIVSCEFGVCPKIVLVSALSFYGNETDLIHTALGDSEVAVRRRLHITYD